jgi:cytochrome c oxidase subunit III
MSDGAHHGHPSLQHHFDSMQQQVESGKLGMWLFLATEVLLFAGLFCAYTVYRFIHPEVFEFASKYLDTTLGATNTLVLIASSWTAAMAVRSSQLGETKKTTILLVLTLLGAAGFMGIKYVEYNHKFHDDLLWGLRFNPEKAKPTEKHWTAFEERQARNADDGDQPTERQLASAAPSYEVTTPGQDLEASSSIAIAPRHVAPTAAGERAEFPGDYDPEKVRNVHIFFGIYFCLTGLHGLHVIIGAIVIIWVLLRNIRGDFDKEYNLPVDLAALYWHLVDLIWIFLFPLLYLIG